MKIENQDGTFSFVPSKSKEGQAEIKKRGEAKAK